MNKITIFLLAAVLALTISPPAFAQTATTQPTLSAALSGGAENNTLTVLSATGISASTSSSQTFLYCGQEQMQIATVSGTTLTVRRAIRGNAATHPNNEPCWYGNIG